MRRSFCNRRPRVDAVRHQCLQVDRLWRRACAIDPRQREQRVDQPGEPLDLGQRTRQLGLDVGLDVSFKVLEAQPQRSQGRPQLM
jgi:hypothetical protein